MEDIDNQLIEKLKAQQISLSKKLKLKDRIPVQQIKTVAGIDVTFTDIWKNPTTGIACITVLDLDNFKILEKVFAEKKVDFPYIPTFLAYRELPVILEAYKKLNTTPDAFILDGMGIIHPRKMGIAAHFGVITDSISVGCGKSKLVGDFKIPENKKFAYEPVFIDGEIRGYILRTKKNANPVFVSPGNNISLESSLKLVMKAVKNYKLPEPTRLSHLFLQEYRRKRR
ncbi:Endonuclease V [Persephonella hydrogeniphila]|uniref:Endonuclease V n=1 Tax=Persephonella hydrogeniphila TaxID=198703 RepID=A0A285MZ45_9AQUI|nr:endonuclease V [Persephonella hydrogeniphila]SNZ02464.1 Endonuclease V [Persephonella hydrogeniphila]